MRGGEGEGKGREACRERSCGGPSDGGGRTWSWPPGGRSLFVHDPYPSWLGCVLEAWLTGGLSLPQQVPLTASDFLPPKVLGLSWCPGWAGGRPRCPSSPGRFQTLGEQPPAPHSGGRVHPRAPLALGWWPAGQAGVRKSVRRQSPRLPGRRQNMPQPLRVRTPQAVTCAGRDLLSRFGPE